MAKTTRRKNGEGTIYFDEARGKWGAMVDLGTDVTTGKRRRKLVRADTVDAVVQKMKLLHGRDVAGQLTSTTTPTVAAFLTLWFETHSDEWADSTRRGYQDAIDRYLVPAFGTLRLEALTPSVIQAWLTAHKKKSGARRRITLAHAVLRSALTAARQLQLVPANHAMNVSVPAPKKKPIVPFTIDEAQRFLAVAKNHRLYALFSVGLACGLRLGEACGLAWKHVNLETGDVEIVQQLQLVGPKGKRTLQLVDVKTEKSRRALVLPDVCLKAMRAHRQAQRAERLKVGRRWVELDFCFTAHSRRGIGRVAGVPLHPRNVLRALHELLDKAKLPRRHFHSLRHSAASLLLAEGVELSQITLLLGHSELRVTQDLYSHLMKPTAARAARIMDSVLGGGQ